MDQRFRRKADADGIGADCSNGFRPSENPVSSVLAMSVRHSLPKQITELFEWDPTEKVATRPMFMQYRVPGQTYALFYTHDGNKNVSEVVHFSRANGVAAHYEYAPFGEVTAQVRQGGITAYDFASLNPWRFSSEYADDASATVYYNYRHYEPMMGRWLSRDPMNDAILYLICCNRAVDISDLLGLLNIKVEHHNRLENIPKGKWGVTMGVKNVKVTQGNKTFKNGCCWFDIVPEFEIKLTVATPFKGKIMDGIEVDETFAEQTLKHENKHVAIVEGVAKKYLMQGESELKQLKQQAGDRETCFMILDDYREMIVNNARNRYLIWEETIARRLDLTETAKEKFRWFFFGRCMRVEGNFDVQAALNELGD